MRERGEERKGIGVSVGGEEKSGSKMLDGESRKQVRTEASVAIFDALTPSNIQ